MADSNTTTYSFTLPEVGASADSWGTKLNANWDKVDDLLDGSIAVNGITVTGGSIDGTPVGATTPSTGAFTTVTTTGNVDVTGTVTADALTVQGSSTGTLSAVNFLNTDNSANATANRLGLGISNSSGANYTYIEAKEIGTDSFAEMNFYTGVSATKRMTLGTYGDVSFFEDSGTTAKMVWDASDEQLILGGGLAWANNVTGLQLGFNDPDGYVTTYYDNTTVTLGAGVSQKTQVKVHGQSSTEGSAVTVQTGGAERMRIDSSGNVGIANSAPVTRLDIDGFITLRNSAYPSPTSGVFKDGFIGSNDGTLTYAVNGASNGAYGSHKFQVRKGDSSDAIDAMTIDSSGNVGIGTSAPSAILHVEDSNPVLRIKSTADTEDGLIHFADTSSNFAGVIAYSHNGNDMKFFTNQNERARIDASGNLLVGQTSSTDPATDNVLGSCIRSGGLASFSRSSTNATLNLNKNYFDGSIVDFRKNGNTVGSIGTYFGTSVWQGGGATNYTGLVLNTGYIEPAKADGSSGSNPRVDAGVDLGSGNYRFKDLYLSGGVYLGGTGSANKLDDYEEGNFTAAITTTGGSVTLSASNLRYVKIGSSVTVGGRLTVSSVSSPTGAIQITLPFRADLYSLYTGFNVGVENSASKTYNDFTGLVFSGTSTFRVYLADSNGLSSSAANAQQLQATTNIDLSFTYMTNS